MELSDVAGAEELRYQVENRTNGAVRSGGVLGLVVIDKLLETNWNSSVSSQWVVDRGWLAGLRNSVSLMSRGTMESILFICVARKEISLVLLPSGDFCKRRTGKEQTNAMACKLSL